MSVQPTSFLPTASSAGAADPTLLAPDGAPVSAPSAAPNARDEAIRFARAVMGSDNSPYKGFVPADRGYGSVIHNALRTLGNAYASSAPADRPAIAQDGDRLLGLAREAGLMTPGRTFAALYKNARPVAAEQPRPAAAPAAAATAAPAPAAGPAGTAVAPSSPPRAATTPPSIVPTRVRVRPAVTGVGLTGMPTPPAAVGGVSVTVTNLPTQPKISPHSHHSATKLPDKGFIWHTTAGKSATGFDLTSGAQDAVKGEANTLSTVYARRDGKRTTTVRAGVSSGDGPANVWGAYRIDNPSTRFRGTSFFNGATDEFTTTNEALFKDLAGLDLRTRFSVGAHNPDISVELGLGQRAGLADAGGFNSIDPKVLNGFPMYAAARYQRTPTNTTIISGRLGYTAPRWQFEVAGAQTQPATGDATTTLTASGAVRVFGSPDYQPPRIASGGPAPSSSGGISHLALNTRTGPGASLHGSVTSNLTTGDVQASGTATYAWQQGAVVASVTHNTATDKTTAGLNASVRVIDTNPKGDVGDLYIIGGVNATSGPSGSTVTPNIGVAMPVGDDVNAYVTLDLDKDKAVKAGMVLRF